MPTSTPKTSNVFFSTQGRQPERGFSLLEIMVALLLVSLIFFAIPSGDVAARHRALQASVDDIKRSVSFAANESVLRNAVVRLRIKLEKNPIEYTVEYGPQGNVPLPDMPETANMTLKEKEDQKARGETFNKQFNPVPEFDEIKRELDQDVTILAVGSTMKKDLETADSGYVYFYPTGERDGALIFFSSGEEIAWLEIPSFLPDTRVTFEPVRTDSVAKVEDVIMARVEEVYKEWLAQ